MCFLSTHHTHAGLPPCIAACADWDLLLNRLLPPTEPVRQRGAAALPQDAPLCAAVGLRQHHRLHHQALHEAAADRARAGRGRGRDGGRRVQ